MNPHADPMAPPFLRIDDPGLAAAVIRGAEQSPTFRAILERLASSDLIVYLRRGRLLGKTAAATQLLTASGGYRYVRVTLEIDPASDAGLDACRRRGRWLWRHAPGVAARDGEVARPIALFKKGQPAFRSIRYRRGFESLWRNSACG